MEDPIKIPATFSKAANTLPAFALLTGHSFQELLLTEYQATSLVLSKKGRPHLSIHLDRLDERSMGALYFALATLTAITGTLWEVNPFDQPGVEEGKVYIRQSLNTRRAEEMNASEMEENSPLARLRREK